MSTPKSLIVSHNFNPGHYSHLIANQKLLSEAGYNSRFHWNAGFNRFSQHEPSIAGNSLRDVVNLKQGDLLVVWFPSLRALLDMAIAKMFTRAKVIYIFHEPVDSIRAYLASGFGLLKTARIMLISLVNRLLVAFSDKIVLPSENAYKVFKSKYSYNGEIAKISLMFDDECGENQILDINNRRFVAYIGTIAEDHAFDEYVKFIIYALKNNILSQVTFLIATRSELPQYLADKLADLMGDPRLKIVSGKPLSNDEINTYFSQSIVVWNAYRRSMQSGVLPKAFMFGTPVIISENNQSEYFVNNETGVEISRTYKEDEICDAIMRIKTDFPKYSHFCREKFLQCFYYKTLSVDFMKLVNREGN